MRISTEYLVSNCFYNKEIWEEYELFDTVCDLLYFAIGRGHLIDINIYKYKQDMKRNIKRRLYGVVDILRNLLNKHIISIEEYIENGEDKYRFRCNSKNAFKIMIDSYEKQNPELRKIFNL